jgi:hypothetical protein
MRHVMMLVSFAIHCPSLPYKRARIKTKFTACGYPDLGRLSQE